MRHDVLIVIAWLMILMLIGLIACDAENPITIRKMIMNGGDYEGIVANNSSYALEITYPCDGNISWKLEPLKSGERKLIKLCLEDRTYTFKAYYASDDLQFTHTLYPLWEENGRSRTTGSLKFNRVKKGELLNSVTIQINNIREDVVISRGWWIEYRYFSFAPYIWRSKSEVWGLTKAREYQAQQAWHHICDWGVIFSDEGVEYLP